MADDDYAALLEDFRQFVGQMDRREKAYPQWEWTDVHYHAKEGNWWYHGTPGFHDFNKEICPPGHLKSLPDGGVGIRSDDDFWTEAIFPWRFWRLRIEDMAAVLWPEISDPVFHPDTTSRKQRDDE